METNKNKNLNYASFYSKQTHQKLYPTEMVVRTLLAKYPGLNYPRPQKGDSILDIAFGDGRNTILLCDMELDVYGIEISEEIVDVTLSRLKNLGYMPDLKIGRNSRIPYSDNKFDYILACHCCYYCDEGETLATNLKEYSRVLKPGGYLIASVADKSSYIFNDSKELSDGTSIINNDPYSNRNGYRLQGFSSEQDIEEYFLKYFHHFSFGRANNNYYGIDERLFWVVCENKSE